ncbi:MAG: polynucleotide kinase-phosphatase, partial [Chloroflexota bacterium]
MNTLAIPDLSLVVLIGPSGAGKSSFAGRHFRPTEVLSSDVCRALVSDDENDLSATTDAFDLLHFLAAKRLARGKLTVVDATNVQPEARQPLVALARRYHCLPVAIVFDLPERLCLERNRERPERTFGPHVVRRQHEQMRRSLRHLQREGFRYVFVLHSVEEVDAAVVVRQPLYNDRRAEHGPFDIIGDIHGCYDELTALLAALGYAPADGTAGEGALAGPVYRHPQGRHAVFLGDLVDRGSRILATLALVRNMVTAGSAFCIPGNHDSKLRRKLEGREVQISHGLQQSLAELAALPAAERERAAPAIAEFLDGLVSHYVFDDGKLVVAHAGMKETMQGGGSREVREFALYGETTGETDEFGLPIRFNWAAGYRGKALVVYGHTPVPEPEWLNGTINIDTGCFFGGRLTALRYPERELVSVPAARVYAEPVRPFPPVAEPAPARTAQQQDDDLLDLEDVTGKRLVTTNLLGNVTIPEPQAMAALEVMSRFAADPHWLIYLPPTMSPSETSALPGLLEHPAEAFAYFRTQGIAQVVCEEKHMGSRAVVVICRDEGVMRRRFGLDAAGLGICYTRTGRRFFDDATLETALLAQVQAALKQAGIWEELATDWCCLDCELLPWSAKAQDLLRRQYAPVGTAARVALAQAVAVLAQAEQRGAEVAPLLHHYRGRAAMAQRYVDAYRCYCWPVESLADLKLAPFHLLASEGAVHADKDHLWHLAILERLCRADASLFFPTAFQIVDVTDAFSQETGIRWWEGLTAAGGEGMVVKPLQFISRGTQRLVQPAVKCRGPEYLRLIYGPE